MLLASADGQSTLAIARTLRCNDQTVRNAIHDWNERAIQALQPRSSRPHTIHALFDARSLDRLRSLLHQSPRSFSKETSVWTLELAAEVSFAQGLTSRLVSDETIRAALSTLGVRWKRAKHWITSPDPEYLRKKRRDRLMRLAKAHPTWVVGFEDEVWWSRLAQPEQHRWVGEGERTRLQELERAKDDKQAKALACYGVLVRQGAQQDRMMVRFVDGRPVSEVTIDFLGWCRERLAQQGVRAWLLIWDNASWHKSEKVRSWLREHNREVKATGKGVRIVGCLLPSKRSLEYALGTILFK